MSLPHTAAGIQLMDLCFINTSFDNAPTPAECAVNCQGSVQAFTNDCPTAKVLFIYQRGLDCTLFVLAGRCIILHLCLSAPVKTKGTQKHAASTENNFSAYSVSSWFMLNAGGVCHYEETQ